MASAMAELGGLPSVDGGGHSKKKKGIMMPHLPSTSPLGAAPELDSDSSSESGDDGWSGGMAPGRSAALARRRAQADAPDSPQQMATGGRASSDDRGSGGDPLADRPMQMPLDLPSLPVGMRGNLPTIVNLPTIG